MALQEEKRTNRAAPRAACVAVVAALIIIIAGVFAFRYFSPPLPPLRFTLADQHNRIIHERDVLGAPALVFFGFTRCDTVCPLTLQRLADVQQAFHAQERKLGLLFITVDPEYDTPAVLFSYLRNFPAEITGLTGTEAELEPVYEAFRVYAGSKNGKNEQIDHSGFIYLIDENGAPLTHFTAQLESGAMLALVNQHLAATPNVKERI